VSTGYVDTGRVNQKRRTREALVAAARQLVAEGRTPTVEEAAAAAGISRTTAYRYFTSQRVLLGAAHPETAAASLLTDDSLTDPRERLDATVQAIVQLIIETEPQQRTMLRLSLEATPDERAALPLRQGRAIGWLTEALEPLRGTLSPRELQRLVYAVRATTGIEALVWLTDVAGLSRKEAADLVRSSALAIYDQAVGASSVRRASATRGRPRPARHARSSPRRTR
jgi:AcrR family transcriptional regulator